MPSDLTRSVYSCTIPTDPDPAAALETIAELGAAADHWVLEDGVLRLALHSDQIERLRSAGIDLTVGADLRERARHIQRSVDLPTAGGDAPFQTGFVNAYLDTAQLYGAFASLAASFPSLCTWTDLPEPTAGYDGAELALAGPAPVTLLRIRSTAAPAVRPGLLLVTGMHAREWVPPIAALEFASQILHNYEPGSSDPQVMDVNRLVDEADLLIVPVCNPDGVNYSHHDDAMWRKNRRPNPIDPSADCQGVDLNRNFSVYWGGAGSSGLACDYEVYRGPTSFSEPETRCVRWLAEQYPNVRVAVDCHSYGEKIYRPQPTGGSFIGAEPVSAADHAIYLSLETSVNAAISSASPGKTYGTGTTSNHAGTTDEYLFFGHRMFGFDLECALDFQPNITDGLISVQEVAAAMRALGLRAIDLAGDLADPVSLMQVIDKSGSMITFGYVDSAKANAKRLVDLCGPVDSVGIAAFSSTAALAIPLTSLADPGQAGLTRAAIDTIAFGGMTSIGAGLEAAFSALSGASGKRNVVLISDGHQNTPPTPNEALSSIPSGTRVHTIALGPASDQPLLQSIAAATGGEHHYSPDELDLYVVYDHLHAAVDGADVVISQDLDGADGVAFPVEGGAEFLRISVGRILFDENPFELLPPPGSRFWPSRVRRRGAAAHRVLEVLRPEPGIWRLAPTLNSKYVRRLHVGVFLKSELDLRLEPTQAGHVIRLSSPSQRELQIARFAARTHLLPDRPEDIVKTPRLRGDIAPTTVPPPGTWRTLAKGKRPNTLLLPHAPHILEAIVEGSFQGFSFRRLFRTAIYARHDSRTPDRLQRETRER
jgi:hypothetical protein